MSMYMIAYENRVIQVLIDMVKVGNISIEQGADVIGRIKKMNKYTGCCKSELSVRPVGVERKESIPRTHTADNTDVSRETG